jgi:hypothetical protein
MMRTYFLLAILVFSASLASQDNNGLTLNFTATHTCTNISLDSILIENLSRPGSMVIYYPQANLSLVPTSAGTIEAGFEGLYISPNYPNPFSARTDFDVFVPGPDIIRLDAYDLTGRLLASLRLTLDRGTHNFTFFACGQQNYIVTVTTGKAIHQRLMTGNGIKGNMPTRITYNGIAGVQKVQPPLKNFLKSGQEFSYETGDELKFTGFVTGPAGSVDYDVIIDIPHESTDYSFGISNVVPDQPSAISGPVTAFRTETGLVYKVEEVQGLVYSWDVPVDWLITGGQGTHSITVDAGYEKGEITVITENNCGTGAERSLAVNVKFSLIMEAYPPEAGSVRGEGLYQDGEKVNITASPNPGWKFARWTDTVRNKVSDFTDFEHVMPKGDLIIIAHFLPEQGIQAGDAENRPFDPDHPVYQPIPENCPLYIHSDEIIENIVSGFQRLNFDTGADSPPIYIGHSYDPEWTLVIHGKSFKVRAPADIKAGSGVDYPLVIFDRSSSEYNGHPVEYRMWQANIDPVNRRVTCNGGGVGVYANDGRILDDIQTQQGKVKRALGQADIFGQNTGSGCSYTVGMIRPVSIENGRIDHAIRVAIGYPHGNRWFWPATRTEWWGAHVNHNAPMGARIFIDHAVDVDSLATVVEKELSHPLNKAFARIFIVALQEFGMIALDGSGGNNIYFESAQTADWESVIGPKNAWGTYNDIMRAIVKHLPWHMLRVADESVFDNYGR